MSKIRLFALLTFLVLIISCTKDDLPINATLKGYVQKGPFLTGSGIIVQELSDNLVPNGITYHVSTVDDFGSFALESEIQSEFVEVIADGFYFNEISGEISEARIQLRYLAPVSENLDANINILTTLAKERIEYLMREESLSYSKARDKAQKEILAIFNITDALSTQFSKMSLSGNTDADAILMAVSVIIQGDRSEGEMSEFIQKFILDIREDGKLDTQSLREYLVLNAENLDLKAIRNHLKDRYETLGLSIVVPPFEKYAQVLLPLRILNVHPQHNGTYFFLDDSISVSFNKPINVETLTENNFFLESNALRIEADIRYSSETGYTICLIPKTWLIRDTEYQFTLSSEIKALDNSHLPTYKYSFTTLPVDVDKGLIARYTLNGSLKDITGTRSPAYIKGGVFASDRFGNPESCVELFAHGDHIKFPYILNTVEHEWSYSLWFSMNKISVGRYTSFLATSESGNDGFADFPLYKRKEIHQIASYSDGNKLTDPTVISTNRWYHVVLVVDNGTVSIYLDGLPSSSRDNFICDETWSSFNSSNTNFYLGSNDYYNTYHPIEFIGFADDIRFYDRALNKFEVGEIYANESLNP